MSIRALSDDIYKEILTMPVIDVHSHINRDRIVAPDVETFVLYHVITYHLRSVGMPEDWLYKGEKNRDLNKIYPKMVELWPQMENTGFAWMLKTICKDLYDVDEPFSLPMLEKLRKNFSSKSADPTAWAKEILDRMNVKRMLSSYIKVKALEPGQWDGCIRHTVEDTPFSGSWELWNWQDRLAGIGKDGNMEIKTAEDFRSCMHIFFNKQKWEGKGAVVCWVGSSADFMPVKDSEINAVITKIRQGEKPNQWEHNILEALFIRGIADIAREHSKPFQLAYGIQAPTPAMGHHMEKSDPQFARTLGYLLNDYPDVHFNIMNGVANDDSFLSSLCTAYNNISLTGFWWQAHYPSVMHQGWHVRLDKVPVGRLVGFFSDGWSIEWVYGRLRQVQKVISNVLAEKIDYGFYSKNQAISVAQKLFYDTPKSILCVGDKDL